MSGFILPILLKEEFVFHGTIEELNEKIRLDNNKKFRTEWTGYNRFKFFSKWSLGTLTITGFPKAIEGIKGFAELKKMGEHKTKVELRTEVRVELYVVLISWTLMCIIGLATQTDFPLWIPFLLPMAIVWFWSVYRVQEKILFNKVKDYLVN